MEGFPAPGTKTRMEAKASVDSEKKLRTLARTRGRIAKSFWSSGATTTEWVGDDREVVVGEWLT